MESIVKISDFVVNPYTKSSNLRATYQICNTLIPYIFLWFLAVKLAPISVWFIPPIVILLSLFSVRCFSLMHDCGHYSLFRSRKINRIVGFVLGTINSIPLQWWSRDHNYHHKTNGDWERYRGIGTFLSIKEFSCLSKRDRQLYKLMKSPLMIFPEGFLYLAFKPRLMLIAGIYDFCLELFASFQSIPDESKIKGQNILFFHLSPLHPFSIFNSRTYGKISRVISSHQSKYWSTAIEFWDILFNNICVVGGSILLSYWLGPIFFLGIYSLTLTLSAAIFISIFFVQHNFEGAYAHKTEGWEYLHGAIEGSSYLDLPQILKWFTADISYHSIHHICEKIPNYNIRACHQRNIHLLTKTKTIRIGDMLKCSKYILWDSDSNQLVSIDEVI